MRVVFLGSPPFALPVFEQLLASPHEIAALVTQPDRPRGRGMHVEASALVVRARERGMQVLQPEKSSDPAFVGSLRELAADLLLVASYGEILREEVLTLCPQGALNVHASLLPRHRGASPIQAAILAGDPETGVSIQRMVKRLDAGDLLLELRTPIGAHETAGELLARLAVLGGDAAVQALELVASGRARFVAQDESEATYARKIDKEHGRIEWTKSAVEIDRLVRAMNPWPLARTGDGRGGELAVLSARVLDDVAPAAQASAASGKTGASASAAPGMLLESKSTCRVATGAGQLELVRVKPAGRGEMDGAAWLRGARLEPGTRL